MTIILPFGRALSQHLSSRSNHLLTRLNIPTTLVRVLNGVQDTTSFRPASQPLNAKGQSLSFRKYATSTTSRAAGRPKGSTGKTTAAKTASKSKKAAKGREKKPVRKTKTKAKAKPKPKAKPKRKALSATALKKKAASDRKDLKARALLDEPKKLPETAYLVYFVENKPNKGTKFSDGGQNTQQIAANYKSLSPLERERLNHTANENKSKNNASYKQWLSKYTPLQVRQANQARRQLTVQKRAASKSARAYVPQIKDDRVVKRPTNSYTFFNTERHGSGDFKNMSLKEAVGLISREWKQLSSSAKQVYEDRAKLDRARYIEEYKTVYGQDPPMSTRGKSA